MVTSGIVREWHDDEGWGVIDAPDAPGGCWAHFSSIETPGYRWLRAGQVVTLEFEAAEQDGCVYRAISVGVGNRGEGEGARLGSALGSGCGAAYSSTLTIRYTNPDEPDEPDDVVTR